MVREGYYPITLDENTFSQLEKIKENNNFQSIPETIRAMIYKWNSSTEKEIKRKIRHLLELVVYNQAPFSYFVLEQDLTEEEEKGIYELMEETSKKIEEGKKVSHFEFENGVYKIIPKFKNHYHMAEAIVATLNKEGKWQEVYKYMKKDGMNLR